MRKIGHDESNETPSAWDEATKSALFRQIVAGKLSIPRACQRHGLGDELLLEWLRAFRRSSLRSFAARLEQRLMAQGAPASAFGGAEFSGSLADLSVADLVQIIELGRKSAVISVSHDAAESRLWCSAGAIIDAESGRLRGELAVYRILALERGQLVAELRASARARSVHAGTQALLLEAARRKDEAVALRHELGDDRLRYQLGARAQAGCDVSNRAGAAAILQLFESPRSLRDALAQSELGDLETLSGLRRLIADAWLVDAGPAETLPLAQSVQSQSPVPWRPEPPVGFRWALGAVGARVLLPAASWLGARLVARDAKSQQA
jgi:transposase-like protein